ncbi:hypothetical protein Ddc_06743 [Ditylenchus destructor]|nr:hypothetical protein Ddc_06743 [Ditylenchus destructor]
MEKNVTDIGDEINPGHDWNLAGNKEGRAWFMKAVPSNNPRSLLAGREITLSFTIAREGSDTDKGCLRLRYRTPVKEWALVCPPSAFCPSRPLIRGRRTQVMTQEPQRTAAVVPI